MNPNNNMSNHQFAVHQQQQNQQQAYRQQQMNQQSANQRQMNQQQYVQQQHAQQNTQSLQSISPQHFLQQMQQISSGSNNISPPNQQLANSMLLLQQSNNNNSQYSASHPSARAAPAVTSSYAPMKQGNPIPSQYQQNNAVQQPSRGMPSKQISPQNQDIQSIYQQPNQVRLQEPKKEIIPPKAPRRSTGVGKSNSSAAVNKAEKPVEKPVEKMNYEKSSNTLPNSKKEINASIPSDGPQLPTKPLPPIVPKVPVGDRIQSVLNTIWQNAGRSRTRKAYVLDSPSQSMLSSYFEELSNAIVEQSKVVALHRKSREIDVQDVNLILGKRYGIHVPGYSPLKLQKPNIIKSSTENVLMTHSGSNIANVNKKRNISMMDNHQSQADEQSTKKLKN